MWSDFVTAIDLIPWQVPAACAAVSAAVGAVIYEAMSYARKDPRD